LIPEEMITRHINSLLKSEPGDIMHHLHVVAAPASAIGPFGLPDPEKLHATVFAIAPDSSVDPVQFVVETIAAAHLDNIKEDRVAMFAAISQETWTARASDELARRLHHEGRLSEHPDAVETTFVYAACRDGRRWRARRDLTGPGAEQSADVTMLVGHPDRHEAFGAPWGRPLRHLVGQQA
jgi:hypothetical protein